MEAIKGFELFFISVFFILWLNKRKLSVLEAALTIHIYNCIKRQKYKKRKTFYKQRLQNMTSHNGRPFINLNDINLKTGGSF